MGGIPKFKISKGKELTVMDTKLALPDISKLLIALLVRLSGKEGDQWLQALNYMLGHPVIPLHLTSGVKSDVDQDFGLTSQEMELTAIDTPLTFADIYKPFTILLARLLNKEGAQWSEALKDMLGHPVVPLYQTSGVKSEVAEDFNLTPRETEVLQLVSMGLTNKVIAARLGVTEDTVKKYVQNITAKLNATDRTHAATIAAQAGLLGEPLMVSAKGDEL